jgi:hypothetical protein
MITARRLLLTIICGVLQATLAGYFFGGPRGASGAFCTALAVLAAIDFAAIVFTLRRR